MRLTLVFVIMMTSGVWAPPEAARAFTAREADRKGPPRTFQTTADRGTVWDGVYTEAQAARGQAQYEASCRSCHREGPRKDEAFMRDWQGTSLDGLFSQIKATMPAGAPSSLSDAGVPRHRRLHAAGQRVPRRRQRAQCRRDQEHSSRGKERTRTGAELRAGPGWSAVWPQGPDAAWTLGNASEPARTKDPAASNGRRAERAHRRRRWAPRRSDCSTSTRGPTPTRATRWKRKVF